MGSLQASNLAGKQSVPRKFPLQSGEELKRATFVFLAHIGDGEQDTSKRSEIVSMLGSGLKIADTALLYRSASEIPMGAKE